MQVISKYRFFMILTSNFLEFIVQVLQTFHQEIVEVGEVKTQKEIKISSRVKNGIRQNSIDVIVQNLGGIILQNFQSFETKTVKSTFEIFAQLIDWNELSIFEPMIQSCLQILQNS